MLKRTKTALKALLVVTPLIYITLFNSALCGCGKGFAETSKPKAKKAITDSGAAKFSTTVLPATDEKLIVYYFHGTARCPSCYKIEAFAKEAVENGFAKDIASGRVIWKIVNVDEPGQQHFVDEYQLYTKSVVLSDLKDGSQVRWKNLEKVWQLLGDEKAFKNYIVNEVSDYLKGNKS